MSKKHQPSRTRAYQLMGRFDDLMEAVDTCTDQKQLYLAISKMRLYASAALMLKRTWRITDLGQDGKPLGPKDDAEWQITELKLQRKLRLIDAAIEKRKRELGIGPPSFREGEMAGDGGLIPLAPAL